MHTQRYHNTMQTLTILMYTRSWCCNYMYHIILSTHTVLLDSLVARFISSMHQLMSPARKIVGETTLTVYYYHLWESEDNDGPEDCLTTVCNTSEGEAEDYMYI